MTPLRSFRFVPLPSLITIGMALLVWTLWWWADQYQTATAPIVLAFVVRLVTLPAVKLWHEPQARRTLKTHPKGSAVLLLACCAAAVLALWFNSERLVQITMTLAQFAWGAFVIWLALFAPQDLDSRSSGLKADPQHVGGINVIIGGSVVLSAFTSAALMRIAPDAMWVAFMSVGQVLLLIIARWVAVMWVLSQPDESDSRG